MKPHRAWLTASGCAAVLVLAACGGSSAPVTHKTVSQVFTYDTLSQVMVDGWDPATEYSNGILAMSNMYETLTRYNPVTHAVGPLLATSWSKSANGLTWTFQLRHGVYFHTGRPMTAQATKAAILRTVKLNGGAAYIWGAVKAIDTPAPYTLVFHLKYPAPLDLEASADYSAYIYDTKAAGSGSLTKWLNTPHDAGTGPYTVAAWSKGQEFEVIQKAFPRYWGGWSGAHFKKVVFRVVPQDTTSAQLLRTGQVSFVEQMNPSLWKSLRGAPGVKLMTSPSWQNLLGQLSNLPNYTYDPAKAKRLLNQAGYGPGKKPLNLTLTYTQGDSNEQVVATLIKSSLARLNVNLRVQSLAWPTQWARGKSANAAQHQDI